MLLLCTLFLGDDVISEQTILISGPSFFEKTVFSLIYFNLEHQQDFMQLFKLLSSLFPLVHQTNLKPLQLMMPW